MAISYKDEKNEARLLVTRFKGRWHWELVIENRSVGCDAFYFAGRVVLDEESASSLAKLLETGEP